MSAGLAETALVRWARQRLQRQLGLVAAGLIVVASAAFLLVVTAQYKSSILRANEHASLNVNLLLQAALENAMINRDLEGLQGIVARLGQQENVTGVLIANPDGEIRFSSDPALLYHPLTDAGFDQALQSGETYTGFRVLDSGQEVLRSINPVHNQSRCIGCHGTIRDNPINGLLLVDYDASGVRETVRRGAWLLAGLGLVVLVLLEAGLWVAVRRLVLNRLNGLSATTRAFAAGDLAARTGARAGHGAEDRGAGRGAGATGAGHGAEDSGAGHGAENSGDELARLGATFDDMADQLETSMSEMRAAYSSLQALIDAIPDGVRVIAPDFRIIMANKAYCRQIGASPDEVIGQPCYASSHKRETRCVPTLVCCPVAEILGGGKAELTCSHAHVDRTGSELSVEVSAARMSLRIDGVETDCIVESIRDMEDDLSFSQKQRLAEMGSLAAGIAHEVHNPLASISLALKAIGSGPALPDEMRETLHLAETEIANCQTITESLLRLSALPQAERELVDLSEAIRDTATLLSFEATQVGVEIVQEVSGRPRTLARDSNIRNLLFNLSLNAVHAMPEGGRLRMACRTEGDKVLIEIEDNGVGISERDLARIFMPFWTRRADGSRGRGLGLAICSSIVKNLGGNISFRSEVGVGTCVSVKLANAGDGEP